MFHLYRYYNTLIKCCICIAIVIFFLQHFFFRRKSNLFKINYRNQKEGGCLRSVDPADNKKLTRSTTKRRWIQIKEKLRTLDLEHRKESTKYWSLAGCSFFKKTLILELSIIAIVIFCNWNASIIWIPLIIALATPVTGVPCVGLRKV